MKNHQEIAKFVDALGNRTSHLLQMRLKRLAIMSYQHDLHVYRQAPSFLLYVNLISNCLIKIACKSIINNLELPGSFFGL